MTAPLHTEYPDSRSTPLSAVARVELSRARLRAAMAPQSTSESIHSHSWLHRLEGLPVVGAVMESVRGWWTQHPLSTLAVVAGEVSTAVARPVAQRHPFALVLVAAIVGAALAWRRPWRWVLKPALFAGLVPRIITRIVRKLPIDSWMTVLDSTLFGRPGSSSRSQATASNPKTSPA